MAETLIIFAVEKILAQLGSLAIDEAKLAWGFKGELTRLKNSLSPIQALLRDAEQRQDEEVTNWLKRVKEIAYDAEDVLDRLAYEILRDKEELQNLFYRVIDFCSPSNQCVFRLIMAHEVQKINKSLDEIKNDGSIVRLLGRPVATTPPQFRLQNGEIYSFPEESKTIGSRPIGRENDASAIVDILINSGSHQDLSVIAIVGLGGLGKTTLAKLVYNHNEIEKRFDEKIWVCVSETFEDEKILNDILEVLTHKPGRFGNMNELLAQLQTAAKGKNFLLVLDDVWNEYPGKWESLQRRLLRLSQEEKTKGNCIVVTTRSTKVAEIMQTLPMYPLGILSDDECWSIFEERAFSNGGAPRTPDLEQIGREIAKKCAGLPLAAKVLGSMMRSKKEKIEWLSIQNNEIWNLPEDENGILSSLKLSFHHLPSPSLKQCFAYCSMFPKDFYNEKKTFIELWMAHGLLQPSQGSNLEMEDVGNNYFNILLANSLVQDADVDDDDSIVIYEMHDLVHDLARSVLGSESLTWEPNQVNGILGVRHLSLTSAGEILSTIPYESAGKVRTLFSMRTALGDMLSKFKGLRVLKLNGADIGEVPISIGKLKHLRYLDVSRTRIKALPSSIAKLYNLQTLRLMYCFLLKELPNELKKLINLRHLCIDHYAFVQILEMPVGVGQLTCLQTLPFFIVGEERGRQIEELGSLNNLRGQLTIRGLQHVKDGKEAKKANLLGKTNISELRFLWGRGIEGNNNDEDVLEGLQPNPNNLKVLEIRDFGGNKFPPWVMTMTVNTNGSSSLWQPLNNLVKIELAGCNKCEQIPMLGHLQCLRDLVIRDMDNVKCIGAEFYGCNQEEGASSSGGSEIRDLFPALETFSLCNMKGLVDWMEAGVMPVARVVFRCLEELSLFNCPQLTTAPTHISSLRKLEIADCSALTYISNLHDLSSLRSLQIFHCSELTSLPSGLESCTSLEDLTVKSCPNLISFPKDLGELHSLSSLTITDCRKLKCLPKGLTCLEALEIGGFGEEPDSVPNFEDIQQLRRLTLNGWPKLKSLPEWLGNLSSLQELHIIKCENLMYLPSVEAMRRLTKLRSLYISGCRKLKCLLKGLTCLEALEIGGWFGEELDSVLNFEDIQQLRHLSLNGWPELKSLPEWLGNLSSLQELRFINCKNLMHLPSVKAMRRLTKLRSLYIWFCPLLRERCARDSGPEWSKISHIPYINVVPPA